MTSNIISLPFRRTHSLALSAAIRQYISTKYDQHPDMFRRDLEVIDQLRADAINVREPHASGIKKLSAYAAQLVWIGGKFPIDIGADFTWYPALGYDTDAPTSQNNLRFELVNMLYNLAALYSQLALALNRNTTDGLKSACNYFCLSAGVISHLKREVIPDMRSTPPEDMDTVTLESLEQLMLAQAQECFWQKAVMDQLKDASIARLAAKISDYYSIAGDWAVKSEAISSEWIHHMTAKHHHFAAAAQYRAACDCLEKRKYGEEVARLRDSLTCVNEALKEARWINKNVLEDLQGLKNRVQEDLKRAEKDNDIIYLIPVPSKSELRTLDRANMATVKVPRDVLDPISTLGVDREFGQPLFAKLVPFAVHVAASIYAERRDRMVNTVIIDELEGLTATLHEILQSLNLPGALQALERPLGMPHSLVSHAEEIRQQDGLGRLYRSMDDIAKLKTDDRAIYNEGVELLHAEAAEDERARAKYGTDQWNRPASRAAAGTLYAQMDEIDGYLKSAENSDELVGGKLREYESAIGILAGTDRDLEDFVPKSRRVALSPTVEREAANLRGCLNEVSRLEARRGRTIEALREKARSDDINPVLLAEAARLEREYPMQKIEPAQFENLFSQRLEERYASDQSAIDTERHKQDDLISALRESNQTFLNARRGDTTTKEREQALQKLENAYFKYKEIVSNLEVGRRFYNDLARNVGRFREETAGWVYQRRMELRAMEADITTSLSTLALSSLPPPSTSQRTTRSHTSQQRTALLPPPEPPRRLPSHANSHAPLAQPQPTRVGPSPSVFNPPSTKPQLPPSPNPGMWTPDMPIVFGGGPGGQPQQGSGGLPPGTSNGGRTQGRGP